MPLESPRTFNPLAIPIRGAATWICLYVAQVFDTRRRSGRGVKCRRHARPAALNWSLLEQWHQVPSAFTDVEFRKLRSSGIDVFHPAVAFETGQSYDVTRAWFEKWNRFIARHPDFLVRVDGPDDLPRAKQEGKIGIILGMQDANHLRSVDDVNAFYRMASG